MSTVGGSPYSANLFTALAFPQAQFFNAASEIPQFALPTLMSGFQSVTDQSPLAANAFIPPFLQMMSPAAMFSLMQPIAGAGYAGSPGPSRYSADRSLAGLLDPNQREAARMERVLRGDPFARAAFEQAVGGRIVDFGDRNDGRMLIQPQGFNPYAAALGGGNLSPIASQLGGLYQQMNQGVLGAPQFAGPGTPIRSPFLPMALNAFAGMANQLYGGVPGAGGGNGNRFDGFQGGVQGMPLFGTSQGSWNPLAQPGKIQGSNAPREGAHSAQISSVLSDPSLTMEDKIMLALMLICSKMDDDIKRQTEYLNQLQNQQGARGKGGVGGKKGGGDGEKSIDIETKKLERMIQKRSQLFDTLSKIMERYDQSAKNVIQSMRG